MSFDNLTPQEMRDKLQQQAQEIESLQSELEQAHQKNDQYRYEAQLLDFVLDPVISSDEHFNLVTWNQAAEKLYGWKAEEVIGRNATDILDTTYPDGTHPDEAKQKFRDDGVWRGEMIHHHKDGTPIPIMGTTAMVYDSEGKMLGYVTVLRDMTDKIKAEEALRKSEQRYRIISELMSDYAYLYRVDEDNSIHRIWTTDEAFKRITGYERDDLPETYGLYHPDEVKRVQEDVAKTIAGENTEGQYRIITNDGQQKWVSIRRRVLWDETGKRVIGFYGAGKDITARKLADEKLLEYRREEERVQVLQEFIRDASHDLKTPLSTINTSIYLLRQYASDDKQHYQINKLEQHVGRLVTLIEDMFDMSRLDLTENLYRERVDLSLYLNDLIRSFQPTAEQKQIQLNDTIPANGLIVNADITLLNQAISNIIENALVYTPIGGQVDIRASQTDHVITIEIEDDGIGIPADDIPHIFERFYRVDKSRNTGAIASTGLGLSITKKVIDLHNGTITVNSTDGKGTTFTIKIPGF